jgi:hypothetical protein
MDSRVLYPVFAIKHAVLQNMEFCIYQKQPDICAIFTICKLEKESR